AFGVFAAAFAAGAFFAMADRLAVAGFNCMKTESRFVRKNKHFLHLPVKSRGLSRIATCGHGGGCGGWKGRTMYDVHYWPTPNGKKVTILLEELGTQYRIVPCNIGRGDQFSAEFLKMNPNHRMPVLVDHDPVGGGEPIVVFESGAIMLYVAEKEGWF